MIAKVVRVESFLRRSESQKTRRLGGWPRAEVGKTQAPPPSDLLGGWILLEP